MGKRKKRGKKRVLDLQHSLAQTGGGGMTTHAAKLMAKPLNGEPVECTITGYCRTFLYDFPSAYLASGNPVDHQIIYSHDDLRVALVSDLCAYFEQQPTPSQHYAIDVSLRAGVRRTYEKAIKQSRQQTNPTPPLFLVIEQTAAVLPAVLNSGQCFTVDERRDGKEMIEGGREGGRSLLAFHTIDAPWPDFQADIHAVNTVLAAIKAEQNHTGHIERLYECSCFVSSEGHAVYTLRPSMSNATASVASPIEPSDLEEKANRIGSMLESMLSKSDTVLTELFDSIVMDKTKDDNYLRLWYLRLWQALDDVGSHMGKPQLFNDDKVVAGKRTPRQLLDYRNKIAHWHTGKIDHSCLSDLQLTAMELLRRRYDLPQKLSTSS